MNILDINQLKSKMYKGDDFVLVEVLNYNSYKEKHIKGAEFYSFKEIATSLSKKYDKKREIILYCEDQTCNASKIAAQKLDFIGFERVFVYKGGKSEWSEAGYPMEGSATHIKNP